MDRIRGRFVSVSLLMVWGLAVAMTPSCGGGGGGADGAGRGLVLLSFSLDGVDNAVLNSRPQFNFSEAVDPSTVSLASIQVREGPSFGATVAGVLVVSGSTVFFEPQLATLCDQSDSGFKPDTTYRLQVIGFPEQFALRNMSGQSLNQTTTLEFHTRLDTDPDKYADQIPAVGPSILSTAPVNGAEAVSVVAGNRIEIVLSENVDPCTIDDTTVLFHMYEIGDPAQFAPIAGRTETSGFFNAAANSTADQVPADSTTWGADNTTSLAAMPQKILADIDLQQSFAETKIVITPIFGFNPDPAKNASLFPENALLVVELTFGITDYAGLPLTPTSFSFTTENHPLQQSHYALLNEGETEYLKSGTTADVNTTRSPEKVQGYMLFSGDGDNGANLLSPSGPNTPVSGCTIPLQAADGVQDDFDPSGDVLFDTGSTLNTCANSTDGSTAVVWEFLSFHIRSGVTVRVIGVNPAIILVIGDVLIENGGRLLVRGDGLNGAPDGRGKKGIDVATGTDAVRKGGTGVAGGGNGGDATKVENNNQNWKYGHDGNAGFGSADFDPSMTQVEPASDGTSDAPEGGGEGGAPIGIGNSSPWDGSSCGGGGGGHAELGGDGEVKNAGVNWVMKLPIRSKGGKTYGSDNSTLPTPVAGSGGGAAGAAKDQPWRSSTSEGAGAGSGGAGGGFVDLTSSGDIQIFGTVDAAGSRGGEGQRWNTNSGDRGITGGGGGGSGGGIRLLTPRDIVFTSTAVVSAAGGAFGKGSVHAVAPRPGTLIHVTNNGGVGSPGRIACEDSDGIIAGLGAANVVPTEGTVGFYRGVFNATRFQGGGLTPGALTAIFAVGPFNPTFIEPVQNFGGQEDFVAGIPVAGAPGIGSTATLVEVRGYQMLADGTIDVASETDWFSIGSFKDTGVETLPEWVPGHPGDVVADDDNALHPASPHGNTGSGFTALNGTGSGGFEFIQVRMTFFLPPTVGVTDPGGFIDDWLIQFTHDQ